MLVKVYLNFMQCACVCENEKLCVEVKKSKEVGIPPQKATPRDDGRRPKPVINCKVKKICLVIPLVISLSSSIDMQCLE